MTEATLVADLARQLDAVLATLLEETRGSRTTLRIDDAARAWSVADVCAEARREGVASMRGNTAINQRAAATAQWLAVNKRLLIQPDIVNSPDPAPPAALISAYAAKAQMLAPLFNADDHLQGWISVHFVDGIQQFDERQIAALTRAQATVKRLTGIGA